MIVFTVHEPPEPATDRLDLGVALEFIRDGFSFAAAVLAPLWLLAHRVWLALLGYVAVVLLLAAVTWATGAGPGWALLLVGAMHLVIGFEAASLQRWAMESRGWRMLGTTAGRTTEECERRFFDSWLGSKPLAASTSLALVSGALTDASGSAGGLWSRLTGWRASSRRT